MANDACRRHLTGQPMPDIIDYSAGAPASHSHRGPAYVVALSLNATAASGYTVAFIARLRDPDWWSWAEAACAGLLLVFAQLLLSAYGATVFGALRHRRWYDPLPWISFLALALLITFDCIAIARSGSR